MNIQTFAALAAMYFGSYACKALYDLLMTRWPTWRQFLHLVAMCIMFGNSLWLLVHGV